jgi:hypothetical protein
MYEGSAKTDVVKLGKELTPSMIAKVISADNTKLVRSFRLPLTPNSVVEESTTGTGLEATFTTKIVDDRDESERDNIAINAVHATM